MKYKGSCHCKAIQFEFESPVIEEALQCNCSICIRKNAIMSKQSFAQDSFRITQGEDSLSNYLWQDHDVNHYFCKHCGIYPFHGTNFEPVSYRVNLGCVEGVEPRKLNIIEFDGRNEL